MANDWIKMRGGLFCSPKLITISRLLQENRDFRDWLTPGGSNPMNGQLVSDHALRCVTGALLCVTWSWSREFGNALPNGDCLLPHIMLDGIDSICGAPGLGEAMEYVGWASETDEGVILPGFFNEYNSPVIRSNTSGRAEIQRKYRERKKTQAGNESLPSVTERDGNALPDVTSNTLPIVTREKSREEKSTPPNPQEGGTGCVGEPPVSIEAAKGNAVGVPPQAVEHWWDSRAAAGWVNPKGQPIRSWQHDLNSWWRSYKENNPESAAAMLRPGASAQPINRTPPPEVWQAAWKQLVGHEFVERPMPDDWSLLYNHEQNSIKQLLKAQSQPAAK